MPDAVRCLFYSPFLPILSAENQSAALVLTKKWPRMHQILHFPSHYCVSVTTTTLQAALHYPASIPPSSNTIAVALLDVFTGHHR